VTFDGGPGTEKEKENGISRFNKIYECHGGNFETIPRFQHTSFQSPSLLPRAHGTGLDRESLDRNIVYCPWKELTYCKIQRCVRGEVLGLRESVRTNCLYEYDVFSDIAIGKF